MLQVARLAPRLLSDATDLVVAFLKSQEHPDGGFRNRAGQRDLYYTVFGLEGLAALRAEPSRAATISYLCEFEDGRDLDLVHLASLARCWTHMPPGTLQEHRRRQMLERLAVCNRSAATPAGNGGGLTTAYDWYLAAGAYQDLGSALPNPAVALAALDALRAEDGGFSNRPGARAGSTPATAAAVTLGRYLGASPSPDAARWLRARCYADGGFFASPGTPVPDLLSTATALHALVGLHEPIDDIKEPCLNFIDSLWTSKGGFYGSWADEVLDCEYTYYGLLALGHLCL
jgi:prenyltransferase beta subunit